MTAPNYPGGYAAGYGDQGAWDVTVRGLSLKWRAGSAVPKWELAEPTRKWATGPIVTEAA